MKCDVHFYGPDRIQLNVNSFENVIHNTRKTYLFINVAGKGATGWKTNFFVTGRTFC